jgi:hypothetical protein
MMSDQTPKFPRTDIIERQVEEGQKALKLKKIILRTNIRAGAARYGLPGTKLNTICACTA